MTDYYGIPEYGSNAAQTIEKLRELVDKMQNPKQVEIAGYKFIPVEHAILKGTQTLIILGDKGYFWNDLFEAGEYKVINIPEMTLDVRMPLKPFAPYIL